ncbi:MAG: AAA family ATPase [Candidatus Kurthia intestinigallinarum]
MNKPLYLFVGKSGSGKSTIAKILEDRNNLKQLRSYTTRHRRNSTDIDHIFITEDEFYQLQDVVAYTFYNGNYYGATAQQVDDADIYVIDVYGVKELLEKYHGKHHYIFIVYFDTTVHTRIRRMLDRDDSDMQIVSRLLQDEKTDWLKDLQAIAKDYDNVKLFDFDANGDVEEVYRAICDLIKN